MNPKAPDYSCRDKEGCKWVLWPPKGKKTASPAPVVKPAGPKWSWQSLGQTARRALVQASAAVQGIKPPATSDNVMSLGISIFIEACRSGVYEPPTADELAAPPKQLTEDDGDSDIPF